MGILIRGAITSVAIFLVALVFPDHIKWGLVDYGQGELGRWLSLFFTAIVLGLVNAIVRPVLVIVSLPLTCATLGLFIFVINALMLLLVSAIPQLGFAVDGFLWALIGSILISLVSGVLSKVVR
ncbi:MAG TPA: phage holin family protein [Candidatus Limnocylindria bacterium]|nr:phage holin family protein [Candidatus Limnocylindria bacterium]